ncbi:butyrophilin subfamily 1 member A1-like [Huso huso]|uniref:Butyrophilin subfamily 1 member A1-like n=1 Tax=Huso huso TaxID=61971 RepID=A0ABR0Y1F2_HUSHU
MGDLVHALLCTLVLLLNGAVTASEEPRSAVHRGDVILNCSFTLSGGRKDLRLQWVKERDGQTETVLAYCGGGVQKSEATASYRDRVYFYPEELTWGSAPLWLHDVELSDQGKYTCYVEDRRVGDSEQMTVHVEVKDAETKLEAHTNISFSGADQSESQSILPYAIGVVVCLATVAIIVKILVKLQNGKLIKDQSSDSKNLIHSIVFEIPIYSELKLKRNNHIIK